MLDEKLWSMENAAKRQSSFTFYVCLRLYFMRAACKRMKGARLVLANSKRHECPEIRTLCLRYGGLRVHL